jgi:hypothetical protein
MRKALFFLAIISLIFLPACGRKVMMDELSADGTYNYSNKDLGFSLKLPGTFEFYQTQRKDNEDFSDLEIFVPTADTEYYQELPGYAKPIVIRVISRDAWPKLDTEDESKASFEKVGENKNNIILIKFWDEIPKDWSDKWSEKNEFLVKDSIQEL